MLNPVFRREVRTVLRNWKSYFAISFYVVIMAAISGIAMLIIYEDMARYGSDPQDIIVLYGVLFAFSLGFIMLIVPALTSGAISSERERQTLDLMLVTKMSTFTIIIGKLFSSMLLVLLMIIASLPVFGIVLYFGGVDISVLLVAVLFLLLYSVTIGSISIFISTIFKKTIISIVLTYIILIFLCFGTLIAAALFAEYYYADMYANNMYIDTTYYVSYILLIVNPLVAFASIIATQVGESGDYAFLWVFNVISNIGITVIMIAGATYMLKPMRNSNKLK